MFASILSFRFPAASATVVGAEAPSFRTFARKAEVTVTSQASGRGGPRPSPRVHENVCGATVESRNKKPDFIGHTRSGCAEQLRSENPYYRVVPVVPSKSLAEVRGVVTAVVHRRGALCAHQVDRILIHRKS